MQPAKTPEPPLRLVQGGRKAALSGAGGLIAAIALLDWRFDVNISFGFLYLFPMLMVGSRLRRPQIAGVAALCTALSEIFDPFPWTTGLGLSRVILTFAAFLGTGIWVYESARNRRMANRHVDELEREAELRREADEQLRVLIESTPASILTLDGERRVLLANEAAHRLLGVEQGGLAGQQIGRYLPALAAVPLAGDVPQFRTSMECRGRRDDGGVFLAQVWFSTYGTGSGPRLAAVVFDASEELREREESSLQQLLAGSKIAVGAVCHEIRNICGAIGVVHAKLARNERLARSEDFQALGGLVEGLGRMAGLELQQRRRPQPESLDLRSALEELRIVIEPAVREAGIRLSWDVDGPLPPVWAERQALLQVFLNLFQNSERAVEKQTERRLAVSASVEGGAVVVRFADNGPGVAAPERLFKPFQPGAEASGLGLYLSRAFLRTFHGDLRHEPRPEGCCFAVALLRAPEGAGDSWKEEDGEDPTAAAGRSHAVSREPQPASGH